jgi:preprotein translocase subunit SecD
VVAELQALTMPMAIAAITSVLNLRLGLAVMSSLTLGCSLDLRFVD